MDSFDYDEARKPSRKHGESESEHSKDWAGGEARPGNQAMQRLVPNLRVQMAGAKGADVDETIARAIQAKRGGGASLDEGSRKSMEGAMGQDFSDVRVHSDSDADSLSRSVKATAFTTGQDIFFRSGAYQPGSTEGNKLLAHELTHVVQQRNAPPAQKLEVSHPEDASEKQAGEVADNIAAKADTGASVARQEEEEEEVATAAAPEEEEEEVATQEAPEEEEEEAVATQEAPEEEEEEAVATQEAPEEEEEEAVATAPEEEQVAMQEAPEEEEEEEAVATQEAPEEEEEEAAAPA